MGLGLLPRNSLNLLFQHFPESGFLISVKEMILCRRYYGASSVPLLYHLDSIPNGQSSLKNKNVIIPKGSHCRKVQKLYSVVARVCKSLSWEIVKEVPFKKVSKKYGLSHSINAFRMMIHAFACAGMHMEVYALLKNMVFYFQKAGFDLFKVFHLTLYPPNNSTLAADVLIKVFAANKLLDHGIAAVYQAKKIGLEPSVYSCNFLLKCLAEASQRGNLLMLFEAMKNSGPSPNVRTYTIMMNFYCTGQQNVDLKVAYEILQEMLEKQISPSAATYSVLVHGLCRIGRTSAALEFVQRLRNCHKPLNAYCYNAVILGLVGEGEVSKAMGVAEEMRNFGISPDVCTYSILIGGLCKSNNTDTSFLLIEDMIANNVKPNLVTYLSFLKGCMIGETKFACRFFRDLKNHGCNFDQFAYNILISRFCAEGDVFSAHELLVEMINDNVAPNALTCKGLVRGSCHMGSADLALNYVKMMVQGGVYSDIITLNHVVKQLCTEGCTTEALQLIDDIVDQGIIPNLYTYKVVISTLCKEKGGSLLEALYLIDKMLDNGILPDLYTYNVVIYRLCKDISTTKAMEFITVILKNDYMFPNVIILNTLMDGFLKELKLEKACNCYGVMQKLEITPTITTYTILINVLRKMEQVGEAFKLFKEVIRMGLNPDTICYSSMIAGLCEIRDANKAIKLFHDMQQRGLQPSVVTYTSLIHTLCKLDRMDEAQQLFHEMEVKNISPDLFTYNSIIAKFKWSRRLDKSQKLFSRMRNENLCDPDVTTYRIMCRGYLRKKNSVPAMKLFAKIAAVEKKKKRKRRKRRKRRKKITMKLYRGYLRKKKKKKDYYEVV